MTTYWKGARPDGWDFYTGRTINYRDALSTGGLVRHPRPNPAAGLCSDGLLHAGVEPDDVFVGSRIPLSLYRISGEPLAIADGKVGLTELRVLEEIDPVTVFKWDYAEAANPIHPFLIPPPDINQEIKDLLAEWVSVGASILGSVKDSVWASIWASVGASILNSVWALVGASVKASVKASDRELVRELVRESVRASVWAYIGSMFIPVIDEWKDNYPCASAVALWKLGLVPSCDGAVWKLHGGSDGRVIYTMPQAR